MLFRLTCVLFMITIDSAILSFHVLNMSGKISEENKENNNKLLTGGCFLSIAP